MYIYVCIVIHILTCMTKETVHYNSEIEVYKSTGDPVIVWYCHFKVECTQCSLISALQYLVNLIKKKK